LRSLALRFLCGQHSLSLRLSLSGDLSQPIRLSLSGSFSRFRSQARSKLRLFLPPAFFFLFPAALFLGGGSLGAQPGRFARLSPGSRKVTVFRAVQIRPGIQRRNVLRGCSFARLCSRLCSRWIYLRHIHLQLSTAIANR
jgi:hypothetical protein